MNKLKKAGDITLFNKLFQIDQQFELFIVVNQLKAMDNKQLCELRFNLAQAGVFFKKIKNFLIKKEFSVKGNFFLIHDTKCCAINIIENFNKQYQNVIEIVKVFNKKSELSQNAINLLKGYHSEKMLYNSIVSILVLPLLTCIQILRLGTQQNE